MTELDLLFHRWEAIYWGDPTAEELPKSHVDDGSAFCALEAQIAAAPLTSLRDYAMKLIVWTVYGTQTDGASHMDKAILAEMLAIAGIAPRRLDEPPASAS